jgi:sugar phosphate isomerase/epimerase
MSHGASPARDRPELSIATSFNYAIPIDVQLPMIASAGFTHISLGATVAHSDYTSRDGRAHLLEHVRRHELRIDTILGPRADQADSFSMLSMAAEAAADLGAGVVVTHPGPFDMPEDELRPRLRALLLLCSSLQAVAKRTGVQFAFENVLPGPATELTAQLLPHLDSRYFGFCYDSSHDQIGGPRPFDLLADLSHRLIAVQLSDRIRDFVDHVIPGEGFIDWLVVASILRASSFAGPLLFEISMAHSSAKDPAEFLRLAYDRAAQLHRRVYGEASEEEKKESDLKPASDVRQVERKTCSPDPLGLTPRDLT